MNINKVFLGGNLTRDPELRYTPSGAAVSTFGIAVNRKYKSGDEMKEDVLFIDIISFGKQAETVSEYLSKGSPVFVEGRLQRRYWEDKEGKKQHKTEIVSTNIQFLSSGKKQEEQPELPEEDDVPF